MSDDERPESLAKQAAAWVPPWERQPRPPDRRFQAEAEAEAAAERAAVAEAAAHLKATIDAEADELAERDFAEAEGPAGRDFAEAEELAAGDDLVEDDDAVVDEISADASDADQPVEERPDDDEERSEAGLSDDDDDFDETFEGANPPGYFQEEEAALTGAGDGPVSVDQPRGVRGDDAEPEPSLGEIGPELPLPEAVEQAAEEVADEDRDGQPADAPLPVDGDDAGDVFDQAADDDVSDDGADDVPFTELVPGDEEDDAEPGNEAGRWDDARTNDEAGTGSTGDQLTTEPAAGDGPEAGTGAAAVPEQGRGRRDRPDAVGDPSARTPEDLPELTDDAELCAALEAILLVVDEPVAEMQLAQILEQPTERVGAMLENLSARYTAAGHGFDLRRAAGGWRLYTRPEYAAYVERFVLDGQSVRLTQAALETLAVVAYKQPVTRSRISAIRGVNCDGVMRTLVTRGLIEECGVEGETGAYLYRTTPLFLEKLGINSVDQLPPLAPFLPDDVEEVLDAPG